MRKPHRKARKLIVHEETWWWVCSGGVYIWAPDGARFWISGDTVKGVPHGTFERGCHKRTTDGMLRPSEVERYIRDHLSPPLSQEAESVLSR